MIDMYQFCYFIFFNWGIVALQCQFLLYNKVKLLYVYMFYIYIYIIYPFICQWTSRFLPCSSFCKQHCNEHWGTCVFFNFGFLRVHTQEQDCWVIWWFYSQFFKESPYCLSQWLYQFIFPPTLQERSLFSTLSPAFIVCRLFDDGHSDWCEVISHCSFDLPFL